jgi:hypothetical protein
MKLKDILSISGMPGLYEVINNRPDGMIVKALTDGKVQFVSGRLHNFSPLDNITVYTQTDTVELKSVFEIMKSKLAEHPVPGVADDGELKKYFETVMPDYDREKVHLSHMKKIVNWFHELEKHRLLDEQVSEPAADTSQEEVAKNPAAD